MAMTTRETFLAERKKGIGGSDIAAVFSVGYGCRRELWYDKRDTPPDYPRATNAAMELGKYLEPYFAELYREKTGRNVVVRSEPVIHPVFPELRVNVDRMVDEPEQPDREPGVLELKAVSRAVYYQVKREGLPEDYILQLQHGMLVTGAQWGSFGIGSRDSGDLLWWDVEQDVVLQELIIAEARAFWSQLRSGEIPDRLEPDDRRCQKCEYRKSCQGAALIHIEPEGKILQDETLRPLFTEYLERKALLGQAEELVEETKEQLKTELGARTAVKVAGQTLYFRPQITMRGDFNAIAEFYDKLRKLALSMVAGPPGLGPQYHRLADEYPPAESYRKPSESRPLRHY